MMNLAATFRRLLTSSSPTPTRSVPLLLESLEARKYFAAGAAHPAAVAVVNTLTPTLNATLPPAVVGGSKATGFRGSLTITNSGAAPASGTAKVNLFLSTDQSLDTATDLPIGTPLTVHLSRLKINGSKVVSLRLKNFPKVAEGTYFLLAQLSGANAATVSSNPSVGTVQITPPFLDLSDGSVTAAPATLKRGKKVTIGATVINTGNVTATGQLAVRMALTTDFSGAGAIPIGPVKKIHLSLAAGATKTIHFSPVVPAGVAPGTYFVVVTVDPSNTLGETTVENNTAILFSQVTVV